MPGGTGVQPIGVQGQVSPCSGPHHKSHSISTVTTTCAHCALPLHSVSDHTPVKPFFSGLDTLPQGGGVSACFF